MSQISLINSDEQLWKITPGINANFNTTILLSFSPLRFPSLSKTDVTSLLRTGDVVDEEPFPPRSNGPQCVPGTPTLGINDFFELQNSEWPWQPPSFHNRENVMLDLFNDQNGVCNVQLFGYSWKGLFCSDTIALNNI